MVSLSPNIGMIAGIPIQLHWTFVLLILLAFFLLVATPTGFFLFLLIVLLFVCVLLHELAHSITSQRNGIKVKKIILLPIGGASVIDLDKVKPELEFRISIVGPVASIVLGLGFGLLVIYAPAGLLKEGLQFLFEINLLLGVFNLLPGFPLDGGRVLRSYLQRKHDFLSATKLAVRASNGVVAALVIGTIAYAALIPNATFFYREFIVLWDVIIALFLYDGAKAELQAAYVKDYTSGMRAKDMITRNYIAISKSTTLKEMYQMMLKKGTHIVLLHKEGKIFALSIPSVGSLAGSTRVLGNKALEPFRVAIPTIKYDENLSKAIDIMRNDNVNVIAVMKGDRLEGILYGPHIESVISFYMAHIKTLGKPGKGAKGA